MSEQSNRQTLLSALKHLAREMNRDQFMILEYLGPIVDGSKAALSMSVEKARKLHSISDAEFEEYMDSTEQSFLDLTICFNSSDLERTHSLVFDSAEVFVFEDCAEPDVVISGNERLLISLLDADSNVSPVDEIGESFTVAGSDNSNIVEALGVLCFTPLQRMALSGIDPSSLLSEDADSIILASASDLVSKIVRKWIDTKIVQDTVNDI